MLQLLKLVLFQDDLQKLLKRAQRIINPHGHLISYFLTILKVFLKIKTWANITVTGKEGDGKQKEKKIK